MTFSFSFTEPNMAILEPWLYVHGSFLDPVAIGVDGIHITQSPRELQYLVGDGGPIDVSADPQIDPGTFIGQELILEGLDDDDMVILHSGRGLLLNGAVSLVAGAAIYLLWNGTLWTEVLRNDV